MVRTGPAVQVQVRLPENRFHALGISAAGQSEPATLRLVGCHSVSATSSATRARGKRQRRPPRWCTCPAERARRYCTGCQDSRARKPIRKGRTPHSGPCVQTEPSCRKVASLFPQPCHERTLFSLIWCNTLRNPKQSAGARASLEEGPARGCSTGRILRGGFEVAQSHRLLPRNPEWSGGILLEGVGRIGTVKPALLPLGRRPQAGPSHSPGCPHLGIFPWKCSVRLGESAN